MPEEINFLQESGQSDERNDDLAVNRLCLEFLFFLLSVNSTSMDTILSIMNSITITSTISHSSPFSISPPSCLSTVVASQVLISEFRLLQFGTYHFYIAISIQDKEDRSDDDVDDERNEKQHDHEYCLSVT